MTHRVRHLAVLAWAIQVLAAASVCAQTDPQLSGQVLDSLTLQPLPAALVYITPDTSSAFIAFAQTGEDGQFRLALPPAGGKLLLHARYLGYEEKTLLLAPGAVGPFDIRLHPKSNELKEIVVARARLPIIQKSDTTIYDVKAFLDSTEYNVEDILKRLPGIEVKADGQIAVNGKPIERVLIEGADLFGRKYTIGTRNIRAGFIGQVEIIDHYQENPVLSKVNTSDAVVLNLKLKDEKKTAFTGTLDAGPGVGVDQSLKGVAHANAFSFSKKLKTILISSNGNTGGVADRGEIESTYSSFEEKDIKRGIYRAPEFQQISGLRNPGLSAEFTDATSRSFSTLRTSYQLGEQWEADANVVLYRHRGRQGATDEQAFFLEESAYRLRTARELRLSQAMAGAELYLKHVSKGHGRSLQAFARWEDGRREALSSIEESRQGSARNYQVEEGETRRDGSATVLFTQKTGSRSVLQLQAGAARCKLPQYLLAQNDDFPLLWGADTSLSLLSQRLEWQHRQTEFLARYIWAAKHFILEVEPAYARSYSFFQNEAGLSALSDSRVFPLFADLEQQQQVRTQQAGLNLRLSGQLGAKTSWRAFLQGRNLRVGYAENAQLCIQTFAVRTALDKKFRTGAEGLLSYAYQEQSLPAHYFISLPYLFDSYGVNEQDIRPQNPSGHLLLLRYGERDALKLRSWFISLRYNFSQQVWRASSRFANSLVISAPFFSRGNESLAINAHWDQFVSKLRSNIRFDASFSNGTGEYAADGEHFFLRHVGGQAGGQISFVPWRQFRLIAESHGSIQYASQPSNPITASNRIASWRGAFTVMYQPDGWQISSTWNRTFSEGSFGSIARLDGLQLRAQRRLAVQGKPLLIGLHIVNFPNLREYASLQSDAYFWFKNAVDAVPAFFLLHADYAF